MSEPKNTEEQMVSIAEVRAAIDKVGSLAAPQYEQYADAVVAELTRPAIHPSVPVLFDHKDGTKNVLCFSKHMPAAPHAINSRVLIPALLVLQWARDRLDMHKPYTDADWMDWWEDKIAHYTAHGEGGEG